MAAWRYHVPRGVAYRHGATPESIADAARRGFLGIDLDTRLTKDAIPVVCHWADISIERFSATGIPTHARIEDLTWAQVSRLRAPDDSRIRALSEVLTDCAAAGIVACIEAKRSDPRWMWASVWERIKEMADDRGATVQATAVRRLWGPAKAARVQRAAKAAGIPNWHRPAKRPTPRPPKEPDVATSQNGWGVFTSSTSLEPLSWVTGRVRPGDVHYAFDYLCRRFNAEVEKITVGHSWGWNYRPIRGQSGGFSNHASATAIDLNAPAHPLGKRGTFNAAQVKAINRILDDLYGAIRWGGNYSGRPDEMHFEVNVNAAQLAAVVKRIRSGNKEKPVVKQPPRIEQAYSLLWHIINDARKQGKTGYATRVWTIARMFNVLGVRPKKEK